MFYLKELEHQLLLHPQYFGADMKRQLIRRLHEEVEGNVDRSNGVIIAVQSVDKIGPGRVLEGKGFAAFTLTYKAIVFHVIKNEVVHVLVTEVTKVGIFGNIGPIRILIHKNHIPTNLVFNSSTPASYESDDQDHIVIQKGTELRVRILACRYDEQETMAIGTIKDDFLGTS